MSLPAEHAGEAADTLRRAALVDDPYLRADAIWEALIRVHCAADHLRGQLAARCGDIARYLEEAARQMASCPTPRRCGPTHAASIASEADLPAVRPGRNPIELPARSIATTHQPKEHVTSDDPKVQKIDGHVFDGDGNPVDANLLLIRIEVDGEPCIGLSGADWTAEHPGGPINRADDLQLCVPVAVLPEPGVWTVLGVYEDAASPTRRHRSAAPALARSGGRRVRR